MTGELHLGENSGITSTGDHAHNSIQHLYLLEGKLCAAGEIGCPPGTIELGTHSAGLLFVGREYELAELNTALAHGSGVITTGLGGVGKSTLVMRYVEMNRGRYNPIWWINAENEVEIEAGLAALARRLYPDLTLVPDPDAAAWGRSWLSCHTGWLVVLDNATDPAHTADLLSAAHGGHVLLTSRLTVRWEEFAMQVRLGVMTPEQALELMARATGRKELLEGAEQLCQTLGHLPLAIRMASAYMKENSVTATAYAARLGRPGHDVLAWTPTAGDPERTVARIWQESLRRITREHGDFPHELLRILAWLAPTDVPVSMLHDLPGLPTSKIDEALGRLAAYALISRADDAIAVHQMVQAAGRHSTEEEPARALAVLAARGNAVSLLLRAAPRYDDPAGWPAWRRLVPHIEALAFHIGSQNADDALLSLLDREASYLAEQGQLARAITLFERIERDTVSLLGPDHPDTLRSRNNLAGAYRLSWILQRALPLYEQNLADCLRVLGPGHPNALAFRSNLAYAYQAAGELRRAIPLYEQTLADRERAFGPDHPETLASRNSLAHAYQAAADPKRAILLYEQTLADSERVLGANHPNTLASRSDLAHAYQTAGDPVRAIPLLEQTLADSERVLGPNHQNTFTSRSNLTHARHAAKKVPRASSTPSSDAYRGSSLPRGHTPSIENGNGTGSAEKPIHDQEAQ